MDSYIICAKCEKKVEVYKTFTCDYCKLDICYFCDPLSVGCGCCGIEHCSDHQDISKFCEGCQKPVCPNDCEMKGIEFPLCDRCAPAGSQDFPCICVKNKIKI